MNNVMHSMWGWSLRHSPLLAIWRYCRGLFQPNRDAFLLLEQASLPNPVDGVIRTTISRTKLWRDEREQIARELIAHAHDALDAGRTDSDIVELFGDPRRVARLLRRSMKRKRPLHWQLYRVSKRTATGMLFVLMLFYVAVVVRFYTGEPEVKVDYGAMIDARNEEYSEDQKSWSTLVACGVQWSLIESQLLKQQEQRAKLESTDLEYTRDTGVRLFPSIEPGHPDYQDFVEAVGEYSDRLEELRVAAALPIVGLPVGYERITEELDGRRYTTGLIPARPEDFKERSLVDVQLIHLGYMRRLAHVLIFDSRLAAREGDADRACEDLIAALGIGRQARTDPYLIMNFVGISIHQMVVNEFATHAREFPGLYRADHLKRLAHTHARLSQVPDFTLEMEKMYFQDLLQRAFSDDGSGGGRITPEAIQQYGGIASFDDVGPASITEVAILDPKLRSASIPMSLVFSNTREQEQVIFNRFMDQSNLVLEHGVQWISLQDQTSKIVEKERVRSQEMVMRFSFADLFAPELNRAFESWFQYQQSIGAFSVMIAIEAYRLEHGELPKELGALCPVYMPEVPLDFMDPGADIKYRVDGDRYVIYSIGSDGNDDDGNQPILPPRTFTRHLERDFVRRYPQAVSPMTNEPIFESSGKPKLADPQGPDGDWILIDTRPSPDRAGAS